MWGTGVDPQALGAVRGTLYRAVDPEFRGAALAGSRSAGRYSRPDEPTLYPSSSVEGVEAAMIAHRADRSSGLEIIEVSVEAAGILDLRDPPPVPPSGLGTVNTHSPPGAAARRGGADAPA